VLRPPRTCCSVPLRCPGVHTLIGAGDMTLRVRRTASITESVMSGAGPVTRKALFPAPCEVGATGLEPGSPTRDTEGQEDYPASVQGVATGQHRTSADTPDTHSERSCGRNVDGMERRVAPSVLPFLLETSPADLRDDSASRGALSLPPIRPVTTSAPSGIPFTCRGRTHQSADPPPAIAALRALQVRHEDVAEEAVVKEIGMWPM
jgi:hypothetical protein